MKKRRSKQDSSEKDIWDIADRYNFDCLCDKFQWSKKRKKCVEEAVWKSTDKYTYNASFFYRYGQ